MEPSVKHCTTETAMLMAAWLSSTYQIGQCTLSVDLVVRFTIFCGWNWTCDGSPDILSHCWKDQKPFIWIKWRSHPMWQCYEYIIPQMHTIRNNSTLDRNLRKYVSHLILIETGITNKMLPSWMKNQKSAKIVFSQHTLSSSRRFWLRAIAGNNALRGWLPGHLTMRDVGGTQNALGIMQLHSGRTAAGDHQRRGNGEWISSTKYNTYRGM